MASNAIDLPALAPCRFGRFALDPAERKLLLDGAPVNLGARAFDLLLVLVARAGHLVSKTELLTLVWSGLVVEENNLQVQISALRKLLGAGALATIPGRGYRFELPVEGLLSTAAAPPPPESVSPAHAVSAAVPTNLPTRLPSLYGRDADLVAVEALIRRHPVVTVAGAGGMGKTRLAQGVAARLASTMAAELADGVWWIELAPVADPALVPGTVARSLGLQVGASAQPSVALASMLASQRLLLVLDNGEHLVDAVAELVDALCANAPGVRILVTSQETLKVSEEHVFRLGALEVPAGDEPLQVARTGAVALFVARAQAVDPRFELTAENVEAAVEICRRLDGIPLAIELAAARMPVLGVEGLRARLHERFNLLTAGSRVVLRRHQTLRATFEWSHGLLSAEQQTVFRRLGVFAGSFTLQAAQEVVEDGAIDRWAALDHLAGLVDKSLVLAEGEGEPRYRLLETARAYAVERLAEAGETRAIMRRHAEALLRTLVGFDTTDEQATPSAADLRVAGLEIDNLRAALAMAVEDDPALAVGLLAHSLRVWTGAWLIAEGFERGLALRACLREDIPQSEIARFWLTLASLGLYSNRREAYDAALRAADAYRVVGNAAMLFGALVNAAVMAVRFASLGEMSAMIAEAEGLLTARATASQRARLEFARFRLLSRQGRYDEALVAAQRHAAIARHAGNLLGANYAMSTVVAAEVQLERLDDALAHAAEAIAELDALGARGGAGHCWIGLASAHALKGNLSEALAACRTAYELLLREEDQRRVLPVLALCAALDGRLADAGRALGYRDAADAREQVIQERYWHRIHDKLEAVLSSMPADERSRYMQEGAGMTEEDVVRRAFGDTHPGA